MVEKFSLLVIFFPEFTNFSITNEIKNFTQLLFFLKKKYFQLIQTKKKEKRQIQSGY